MSRSTDSCTTVGSSNGCVGRPERRNSPCHRLRIDANDGSRAIDYRIEDGRVEHVEHREMAAAERAIEAQWQRLTHQQLTSHVMANTVVAQWLVGRLGLHSLVGGLQSTLFVP